MAQDENIVVEARLYYPNTTVEAQAIINGWLIRVSLDCDVPSYWLHCLPNDVIEGSTKFQKNTKICHGK